ncbi:MAG: xanthine dehydrogenase family protein molybdopterin-binding subunit [Ktedonobacteraceae bacterium]|nr:xanthine dehydrogenase family protein molybdopterin-binding subunit [Ktedonobacteraceae bacterium]
MDEPLQSASERRREDYTPLIGQARYVDDLRPEPGRPPAIHMAIVRSLYAHARITSIELDAVRAYPGVIAAFTGAELVKGMPTLATIPVPGLRKPERRPLAVEHTRYVGDPVAVILAESLSIAEDAREQVEIDYEVLPVAVDPEKALDANAPRLYEEYDSNVAFIHKTSGGDLASAFQQADSIVRLRLVNQRLAPSSLEPRACFFDYDAQRRELSAWMSSQAIYKARETLASFLGIDQQRIHISNAAVGGAFGAKNALLGEEIIAALLSVTYGRPVKWIEQRNENLQAQSQGRGQINYIEAAVQNDGKLLGLRVRSLADLGAFLTYGTAMVPTRMSSMLSGPYQVPAIESHVVGVFTNKATTAPYRGAGRPEAAYILERTMDRIAHDLALDPAEVRRRNFIPPQAFPYTTVTGAVYDSGDYQATLERALELAGYTEWRAKQRSYREQGNSRLLGIGLASFIELSGDNATVAANNVPREAATVRIRSDGSILVQSGVSHNGQGHFTAFAQIAATIFNLPTTLVEVRMNDSSLPAYSLGTYASRTTQIAGSAVLLAAEAVKAKALQLASRMLEVASDDLVMENGQISVLGFSARTIALGELARMVEKQPDLVEREPPNPANNMSIEGLAAWRDFGSSGATYSSGTHLAVVEIDPETGELRILTYVAVDDCGRVLNHRLVDGQLHGGLAQGIGQALYEEVVYDEDGQLLSSTLMDYALPNAGMLPTFVTDFIESPSPYNPLGAKGAGESGCIGAPPAVVNAALDALAPLGIKALDMPLKPEKIWMAMQTAHADTLMESESLEPFLLPSFPL